MPNKTTKGPLIVIVGTTASGKTDLAIQLALKFNGEIVCADSRTVYKGMDISTAKPTIDERTKVPHHLIDITTPDKPINVADFKSLANQSIDDILSRHKLPIMVGGTGLYIDAVIFDFQFRRSSQPKLRQELSKLSIEALQLRLRDEGIALPRNARNPRHLIRALETAGEVATRHEPRPNTLTVGLLLEKDELKSRIEARVDNMFDRGLEQEVENLVKVYGWSGPLQTIGYQEFEAYFSGQQSLAETRTLIVRHTLDYAKRQVTWFKRNNSIHWLKKQIEVVDLITTALNK